MLAARLRNRSEKTSGQTYNKVCLMSGMIMKKVEVNQIRVVWYQDSISGETSSAGFHEHTLNFWVHLEYFPREITEAYLLDEGEARPHPKDGWAYARGTLLL